MITHRQRLDRIWLEGAAMGNRVFRYGVRFLPGGAMEVGRFWRSYDWDAARQRGYVPVPDPLRPSIRAALQQFQASINGPDVIRLPVLNVTR